MPTENSKANSQAQLAVQCSALFGCIGVARGETVPTTDGYYLLDASNADGWIGPSGYVEIVTHQNGGKSWPWCYWIPESRLQRSRCGMPLRHMRGAKWTGPLQPNDPDQRPGENK